MSTPPKVRLKLELSHSDLTKNEGKQTQIYGDESTVLKGHELLLWAIRNNNPIDTHG